MGALQKDLISVIIPVYNVEAYLERCVASVCRQTYENLEIILVDDGSPDNCGSLCDDLAEKDARIQVIHKKNGGLSDARNAGMEKATGEYLAFIDSDDFVSEMFIEHLYAIIKEHHADVSQCSFKKVRDEERLGLDGEKPVQIKDSKEMLYGLYGKEYVEYTVVWDKLYRASLFDEVRFPVGKIHEDEYVIYKIYDRIEKAAVSTEKLYAYFMDENSITRRKYSSRRQDGISALEERRKYFLDKGYAELHRLTDERLADALIYHKFCSKEYLKDRKLEKMLSDKFRMLYKEERGFKGAGVVKRGYYSLNYNFPILFDRIFELYQRMKRKDTA